MRILITGAGGMLGRDVVPGSGAAAVTSRSRCRAPSWTSPTPRRSDAAVAAARPDAVINCAAWTNVDGAESAEAEAHAVNGAGAGHVARAAAAAGAWTVHVSSDYVFDGPQARAVPGVRRRRAAVGVRAHQARRRAGGGRRGADSHTVVRSAWLFGAEGHCFPKTIRRLAAERDELSIVADQVGSPTFTGHLAPALVALADGRVRGSGARGRRRAVLVV